MNRALRMVMLVSRETIYSRTPFSIRDNGCLGLGGEGSLMWLLISVHREAKNILRRC